jgi:phthiocerol/phenolphthiocerol synthesis type-I polyketide synthase E
MNHTDDQYNGSEIAIIGISCRFPGAKSPQEFWNNLRDGVESISFLNDEELEPSNIDPADFKDPNYVKAASILDDIESFDAPFFGFSPREAEVMDPQHRLFLECAWEALEDAGYDPTLYKRLIGVYAGARTNTYLFNLFTNRETVGSLGAFEVGLGNDLAFLPAKVSYKLDLKGPSYAVHTACSTSLVAVHLACQSLLVSECYMALAGGVAVNVPHRTGYL